MPKTDNKTHNQRQALLFATIYQIVSAERRPATFKDLHQRTGHYRATLVSELKELLKSKRIKKITVKVSDTNFRFSYVPADRKLAGGVGYCSTAGCDNDPQVIVAGCPLCAQCARGPVDPVRGGGMFANEREEDRTMMLAKAQTPSASQSSGGWEPAHGE